MAIRKKVLLFNPPPNPDTGAQLHLESLGLGYVAAAVRRELGKSHDVTLWDCSLVDKAMDHVPEVLDAVAPDYVGLSLSAMNAGQGVTLAAQVRKRHPRAKILIGGILASSLPTEELACYSPDAILRGEGEALVPQALALLDDTASGDVLELVQEQALDVDALAWPARDMLPWQLKMHAQASVAASRGCPYRCSFCSIPKAGPIRKWRPRDIDDVVDEMRFLYKTYNIAHFYFVDDNFILNSKPSFLRAERFAKLVRDKLPCIRFGFMCRSSAIDKRLLKVLKSAGLAGVFLGIESFSQAVLDRYNKKETVEEHIRAIAILNDLGITINPGFIFFDPWTSASEMRQTISVMKEIDFPSLQSINSKLTCYRGTAIEQQLRELEQPETRLGICGYAVKEVQTAIIMEQCCDIFQKQLLSDSDYVDYQHCQYVLGSLQPFFLNTPQESLFLLHYAQCKTLWKAGDMAVLQRIDDYLRGASAPGASAGAVLDAHSRERWRKGNACAKLSFALAQPHLVRAVATGSAEEARLAVLAFSVPGGHLNMAGLLDQPGANGGINDVVIAQALGYAWDAGFLNGYLGRLVRDKNVEALVALVESACLTFNFAVIEAVERCLEETGIPAGEFLAASLGQARQLFRSSYPEFILAQAQAPASVASRARTTEPMVNSWPAD
ncbi:B12-binding domain-containing radical SAM protein [Solidesulfovibrio magneticus]|uniref:Uncharacterized protein n=1 Tax=Solidesulfovibrio magneticus (strain ATCC 700980 / DSM 13731 / RS-1) TaxID=573370 RepID=C4XU61_SOLM1|nr:radical SAM protein [Solidesulfovibrio magneticus]BAH76083.1 hypothetical protein DMR_25920 [Solidesulfovibrio magneticus RS-1]